MSDIVPRIKTEVQHLQSF